MFYINDNPILTSELEVLQTLKAHLEINGLQLFNEFKVGTRNIQFNCPSHNNGQERRPSCGITTETVGKTPAGTVHCLACNYTATLEEMISMCFGKTDGGNFGKEWLLKNFLTISIEERKDIVLNVSRHKHKEVTSYISEDELDSYRFYHDYMYKRKLTNEIIEKFDVGYEDCFRLYNKQGILAGIMKCLTFPVRDITGNTLFIARRGVDSKFFHYPDGVDKPIYGVHELSSGVDEVIICESIINALTCYAYGKSAVALLGTGTDTQYEQLKKMNVRKFIIALDPDKAGISATKRLRKGIGSSKIITEYVIPTGKDINDLTESEFNNLVEIF
jgi:DNA primase